MNSSCWAIVQIAKTRTTTTYFNIIAIPKHWAGELSLRFTHPWAPQIPRRKEL